MIPVLFETGKNMSTVGFWWWCIVVSRFLENDFSPDIDGKITFKWGSVEKLIFKAMDVRIMDITKIKWFQILHIL